MTEPKDKQGFVRWIREQIELMYTGLLPREVLLRYEEQYDEQMREDLRRALLVGFHKGVMSCGSSPDYDGFCWLAENKLSALLYPDVTPRYFSNSRFREVRELTFSSDVSVKTLDALERRLFRESIARDS